MEIVNPDLLMREYTEGVLTVRQIAERHDLSVNDVQQFAFDNNLAHGSFKELVRQGVQMRTAYGGNKPENLPATIEDRDKRMLASAIERGVEAKSKHRMAIDGLFKLQELLLEAAVLETMSVLDPSRFHPDDQRILAARAMRGNRESVADQAVKIAKLSSDIIKLDLENVGLEAKKAEGGTNVQVNINGHQPNVNQTAVDERSKLAAVAGMLEMMKDRRAIAQAEF